MLHFILRSNDMMADFLRDYFRQSLTYLEYLQKQGTAAKKLTSPMHWARAWLDEMTNSGVKTAAGEDKPPELVDRIEQLEERIRQLESGSQS